MGRMALYTKSGDDGTTGLFGGDRVDKDHPRVEAIGTVDELNAAIGFAAGALNDGGPTIERMREILTRVQSRLFDLGADLATPIGSKHEKKVARVDGGDVAEVERWIDEIDSGNEEMRVFVLPGGVEAAARLHLGRTVCRRAERAIVALARGDQINRTVLVYVNRLSDLLFAMARRANHDAGVPDVPWQAKTPEP